MVGTHQIETTRTVGLLLLVALACSAAALYLLIGSAETGSVSTPTVSDPSLPHAFPGGN
jgi:hypothetical protein